MNTEKVKQNQKSASSLVNNKSLQSDPNLFHIQFKQPRNTYKLKDKENFNKKLVRNFTPFYFPEEILPEWPSEEEIEVINYLLFFLWWFLSQKL